MGLDFSLAQVTISDTQPPDWNAGFQWLENIEFRTLGVENLEWYWLELEADYLEGEDDFPRLPPSPYGIYHVVEHLRNILWGDLEELHAAVESGSSDLVTLCVPGHRVLATGGIQGGGGEPGPLHGSIYRLGDSGALDAAGFASASSTTRSRPDRRHDGFTTADRRWSAGGRALLHAADDAARLARDKPQLASRTPDYRLTRLESEAKRLQRLAARADREWTQARQTGVAPPRALTRLIDALLEVAAEAVYWGSCLQPPNPYTGRNGVLNRMYDFCDETARLLAETDDEVRLQQPSAWIPRISEFLGEVSFAVDVSAGRAQDAIFDRAWGGVPTEAARIDLQVVTAMCCRAIGVLSPFGVGALRERRNARPPNISPVYAEPDADLARPSFEAFLIPTGRRLRWRDAERAADLAGLRRQLTYLRQALQPGFHRWRDSEKVPGGRIWAFEGPDFYDEEPGTPFRWEMLVHELRAAGILERLGVQSPTAS